MTLEEIQTALVAALPVRVPMFDPTTGGAREKINQLEDYMLLTAFHRGQLEDGLHWALEAQKVLRRDWNGIEGYEVTMRGSKGHTKEQVNDAKRLIRPDLWTGMEDVKGLVESLGRQIRRLELDFTVVSRTYTLITGS